MTLAEAVEMIHPAVGSARGTWADFGAGTGLFTLALARLLRPEGRIIAVDRDARALTTLREAARTRPEAGAEIVAVEGDFRRPSSVGALAGVPLAGALFANALHFVPDVDRVLSDVAGLLREDGRIVVIEYGSRPASRWVPHPISVERLCTLAAQAGLTPPRVVSERPSAYGGVMYCAVLDQQETVHTA